MYARGVTLDPLKRILMKLCIFTITKFGVINRAMRLIYFVGMIKKREMRHCQKGPMFY